MRKSNIKSTVIVGLLFTFCCFTTGGDCNFDCDEGSHCQTSCSGEGCTGG